MPKFCGKCGTKLTEEDVFCPECGTKNVPARKKVVEEYEEPSRPSYQPAAQQNYYGEVPRSNGMGIAGFVLSFLVPILGLIFSIIGYVKAKEYNDNAKGLSLAGILFAVICLIVCSVEYYDHETDEEDGEKVITGWDKFFMFLTMGFNLRLIIFLFFFWVSILIRLIKKTSGSYIDNDAIAINISNLSIEGNTNNTNNVNNINNNINKKDNNSGNNNIVRDVKVSYGIRELSLK